MANPVLPTSPQSIHTPTLRVIGLMSGTSADGIDVAIVEISGAPPSLHITLVQHLTVPYQPALRAEIFAGFRPDSSSVDRLCSLHSALGEAYAAACLAVIHAAGLTAEHIDLIASHGQTLWYDPPQAGQLGATLALGNPAIIAERTGITTISDFRGRDLAAGGRGAPLVAYLDWLLFRDATRARGLVNIGGIANITALPSLQDTHTQPIAFDTGPGNMIIDYCASQASAGQLAYDHDGRLAAQGHVDEAWLVKLRRHEYLQRPAPKATGRELFGVQFGAELWQQGVQRGLSAADITATATAFTAVSIADACQRWLPMPLDELFVAGGGALNPTLLQWLQSYLPQVRVRHHDELGVPAIAKECILFAVLGYETWHGRAGTLPALTGASHAVVLGSITPGRRSVKQ